MAAGAAPTAALAAEAAAAAAAPPPPCAAGTAEVRGGPSRGGCVSGSSGCIAGSSESGAATIATAGTIAGHRHWQSGCVCVTRPARAWRRVSGCVRAGRWGTAAPQVVCTLRVSTIRYIMALHARTARTRSNMLPWVTHRHMEPLCRAVVVSQIKRSAVCAAMERTIGMLPSRQVLQDVGRPGSKAHTAIDRPAQPQRA